MHFLGGFLAKGGTAGRGGVVVLGRFIRPKFMNYCVQFTPTPRHAMPYPFPLGRGFSRPRRGGAGRGGVVVLGRFIRPFYIADM